MLGGRWRSRIPELRGTPPLPITQYLGGSVPLFSGIKPYLSPKTAPSKFVCRFLQVSQSCVVDPSGTPKILGAKLEIGLDTSCVSGSTQPAAAQICSRQICELYSGAYKTPASPAMLT